MLDSEAAADVPVIEVSPLPVDGPLREHLRAWFKRSHALVFADGDQRRAWRRGLQAGRVFVVFPQSSRFPELNALTRVGTPRDSRFRAVRRREWDEALLGLVMIEYVPRRPDP